MTTQLGADAYGPQTDDLDTLATAVHECRGCDLYRDATQAVGPAGRLLDQALEQAGIDRERVYVTNAVKHFKFVGAVAPELVICLGATAAQALLGTSFRVTQRRGERITAELGEPAHETTVVATVHPSSVLRTRGEDRKQAFAELLADLEAVGQTVAGR